MVVQALEGLGLAVAPVMAAVVGEAVAEPEPAVADFNTERYGKAFAGVKVSTAPKNFPIVDRCICGAKNAFFATTHKDAILYSKTAIYQDRLGTAIGKVETEGVFIIILCRRLRLERLVVLHFGKKTVDHFFSTF